MKDFDHTKLSLAEMIEEFEADSEEQSKPFYTDLIKKLIPLHKALSLMDDEEELTDRLKQLLE